MANQSSNRGARRFQLMILAYGNLYYIDRIARLEKALSRKPRLLQIDLIGVGEIPADSALLIRSVLRGRSPGTRIITRARSSLQGGSVLVWLLGDHRIIRDDARLYFRRANLSGDEDAEPNGVWKDDEPKFWDWSSEIDAEEGDYGRVLELINEFLPVKELAGRFVEVPVLRQFGLVENEKVDEFLAAAFGRERESGNDTMNRPEGRRIRDRAKNVRSRPVKRWPLV